MDTFFLYGIHGTRGVMRDSDGTITIAPRVPGSSVCSHCELRGALPVLRARPNMSRCVQYSKHFIVTRPSTLTGTALHWQAVMGRPRPITQAASVTVKAYYGRPPGHDHDRFGT
jgi:hypothetical protein